MIYQQSQILCGLTICLSGRGSHSCCSAVDRQLVHSNCQLGKYYLLYYSIFVLKTTFDLYIELVVFKRHLVHT